MSENKKRHRVSIWLIVAVVLGILLILGLASDIKETYTKSQNYNKAIELIEQGEYDKASLLFLKLEDYKDAKYLYFYANYLHYKDNYIYSARKFLNEIPKTYKGKFADEIVAERPLCEAAYAEYEKEQERLELQRKREEDEYVRNLKNKLPEVGMSSQYIDKTMLGTHDDYKKMDGYRDGKDVVVHTYRWYSDNRRDIVFVAECYNGYVKEAHKVNENTYWTSSGTPNFGAKSPAITTKKKKEKEYPYDEFDVYDYYDEEDFYYDHEDDFWDFEDAEDYFNEAWDKVK